ncbi:MAG: ABC transporter substrate-binding protein [Lachnospiraceae bacterium]|nr:ABC transporter substrate-binding protein [Lachnospiraceae bacterium]
MKKFLALALVGMMTLAMIGCGSTPAPATEEPAAEAAVEETVEAEEATTDGQVYKVGICQLVQHPALDAATEGFKTAIIDALGADAVVFDDQNASGDAATCAVIANQFVADQDDLIFANATPALQAAVAATDSIPIVGTSVTDFATALDIADWTGKTGINVTGTSDLAPLAEQAAMIKELCPDAKTVGILYCSAEANSKYQATVIEESLKELGLEYKEYTAADTNDIALVTTTACNEVDVIYVPTDNTMASSTEIIANIVEPAGIPVIAGEEGICQGCGIGTLSISYYSLGYRAGEMAVEVLKGADPATMDIDFAKELTKKYMADRCAALNITVPADYEEIVVE